MRWIRAHHYSTRSHQSGVAILIALIVLVAMSLAGVAMVRTVDTNTLITSNLTFRQNSILSGDTGIEAARTWLLAQSTSTLQTDSAADGYYASKQASVDLTGNKTPSNTSDNVRWKDVNGTEAAGVITPKCMNKDSVGNRVCYVIHRICDGTGAIDGASCGSFEVTAGGSSQGAMRQMQTYQVGSWSQTTNAAYYRITVRTAGPRNNYSMVQAILVI